MPLSGKFAIGPISEAFPRAEKVDNIQYVYCPLYPESGHFDTMILELMQQIHQIAAFGFLRAISLLEECKIRSCTIRLQMC